MVQEAMKMGLRVIRTLSNYTDFWNRHLSES